MRPTQIASEFAMMNQQVLNGMADEADLSRVWQRLMLACSDNDVVAEHYASEAVLGHQAN